MAFNDPKSYFLAPGAAIRIKVWWPAPGDKGAQWIMAHAAKGEPPGDLVVSDHAKHLDYAMAFVSSEGSGFEADTYYYDYRVTIRNTGSRGVRFNLQGGGTS